MHSRYSLALVAVALLLTTTALAWAAPAAGPPTVADANANSFLLYSAWGAQNDLNDVSCTGTGPAKKVDFVIRHATFRCRVEVLAKPGQPAGTVIAKALGPEWLKVTRIVSGKLTPDRGLGPLPKGTPRLDSTQANSALEKSSWARANDIDSVFCTGVGRWVQRPTQYRFFTFSCAPRDAFMSRRPQVLVAVTGKNSVRVVRTVSQ